MSNYAMISYAGLTRPQLDAVFSFYNSMNRHQIQISCYIETGGGGVEIHCGGDTRQDPLADPLTPLQTVQTQVGGVTVIAPSVSATLVSTGTSKVKTRFD